VSEHSDIDLIREILEWYFSDSGDKHEAQACLRVLRYYHWKTDDLQWLNETAEGKYDRDGHHHPL